MPDGARPVAILCLGHVDQFYTEPMLETERWASRMPLADCVFENCWPAPEEPVVREARDEGDRGDGPQQAPEPE
jgi:5,6-dimethylbenzimidazole synthase